MSVKINDEYVSIATITQSNTLLRLDVPDGMVSSIRFSSTAFFQIYDIATLIVPPFETITVDMESVKKVGWLFSRHYSDQNIKRSTLLCSDDGTTWTLLAELDNHAVNKASIRLDDPVYARYLQVRYEMEEVDYAKAYMWELTAYDDYGPYCAPAPAAPNPKTMAELLGVNGQFCWGVSGINDSGELTENEGPKLFSRVAFQET